MAGLDVHAMKQIRPLRISSQIGHPDENLVRWDGKVVDDFDLHHAESCALVDDAMRRRAHELLGCIVSTGIALLKGPAQQWTRRIEKRLQTLVN